MSIGRSIRLFLADGVPGGIITAEIMNWTGHVIQAPRPRLPDLIKRTESNRTGIYFLTGTDPQDAITTLLYIGETDNVGKRLVQHSKNETEDFWDRACIVTSKDHNLTKGHVRYLESRIIAIAAKVGRSKLVNGTAPDPGALPEGDIADMEFFIEQVRIILPVLGMNFLREAPTSAPTSGINAEELQPSLTDTAPEFELVSKKHGIQAAALEIGGEFVVLTGSLAQAKWIGKQDHGYRTLHQKLIESGIMNPSPDGTMRFTSDYAFPSPSAASAVVLGRSDNGRLSWKVKGTDLSYGALQQQQVAAVAPDGDME